MSFEFGIVVLSLIACLIGLYGWYVNLKRYRVIHDTPTYNIRSAPQGYVELVGRAAPIPEIEIKGKLTKEPCVWYRYKIERRESSDGKVRWVVDDKGDSEQNFAIDDGTGLCIVDPDDAFITSVTQEVWRSSSMGGEQMRFTEQRIHEGDHLYGLGFFQTFQAPSFESELSGMTGEILREWKKDHDWLLTQFDKNRDGKIDLVEWELARQKAAETARYELNESYNSSPYNMLVKSPNKGQELIVSTADPDKLARKFMWHSIWGLAVAVAFFAYIVYELIPLVV